MQSTPLSVRSLDHERTWTSVSLAYAKERRLEAVKRTSDLMIRSCRWILPRACPIRLIDPYRAYYGQE